MDKLKISHQNLTENVSITAFHHDDEADLSNQPLAPYGNKCAAQKTSSCNSHIFLSETHHFVVIALNQQRLPFDFSSLTQPCPFLEGPFQPPRIQADDSA